MSNRAFTRLMFLAVALVVGLYVSTVRADTYDADGNKVHKVAVIIICDLEGHCIRQTLAGEEYI